MTKYTIYLILEEDDDNEILPQTITTRSLASFDDESEAEQELKLILEDYHL